MLVATDALSDSVAESISMRTMTSQVCRTNRDRPSPSEPTTMTAGPSKNSCAASARLWEPSPARPITKQPASWHSFNARTKLVAWATGMRAAAPALVFHAEAVTPAARRCGINTPVAPNAAAERMTAPRLRGSVTLSSATTKVEPPWSRSSVSRYV